MSIQPGTIIVSTRQLDGTVFEKTVIVVAEHNEKGSIGYIINQLFPRSFNELEEFQTSIAVPLYRGGPVHTDLLYFVHRRADLVPGSQFIAGNVYMYGDFSKAVRLLNEGTLPVEDVRLYIGYCGWDLHELEEEVAEGSWRLTDMPVDRVFAAQPVGLWEELQPA